MRDSASALVVYAVFRIATLVFLAKGREGEMAPAAIARSTAGSGIS